MTRRNRLSGETSPYLLLHQHNPVHWFPWGEEALALAREQDKPIFLSVGYATCYWCHVMERESFADAGTAALMNEHFVNIKVDREERPDLDEIYMAATQIFSHQGGWPNSVFLTPDLKPFYAGTYFPPADRHGRPSFKTVLLSMQNAWETRREDVFTQAEDMAEAMGRMLEERGRPSAQVPSPDLAEKAQEGLTQRFDEEWGGFGGSPKFPSPANLHLLLDLADDGDGEADRMLATTLENMARGGVYDQLAGGFHRYATDRRWRVPHFEKMLYDNGQLLEIYARDYGRTGDPERARIVRETARFLERELTSPEGGLWSAIDAEVAGREGAYHVWTTAELAEVLGEEDAGFLAPILGFDGPPFFEDEAYVLHLPRSFDEQAGRRRVEAGELKAQVAQLEARLLEAREKREKPLVDDKILCDWNGMAIAGLATGAGLLSNGDLLRQAERAADFVLEHLRLPSGILAHTWRDGQARLEAFLSDYVFLVHGLLALYDTRGDTHWLDAAVRLTEEQVERLHDSVNGGFFGAGDRPDLLFRSKEVFDGALPATNAMAAQNLITLARHREDERSRWLELAAETLKAFGDLMSSRTDGCRMLTVAARRYDAANEAPTEQQAAVATVANLIERAAQAVVSGHVSLAAPDEEGFHPFTLEVKIKEGWHLDAHRDEPENLDEAPGVATTLEAGTGVRLRRLVYPEGEPLESSSTRAVYRGTVEFRGELTYDSMPAWIQLRYQPCDDRRCLSETTRRFEMPEESVH